MNLAHAIPPVQSLDRNVEEKSILGSRTPSLNKTARAAKELHVNVNLSYTLHQITQISRCFQLPSYGLEFLLSLLRVEQELLHKCAKSPGSKISSITPNLQMKKLKQGTEVICFSLHVVTEVEKVLKLLMAPHHLGHVFLRYIFLISLSFPNLPSPLPPTPSTLSLATQLGSWD